jgi:cell division protein FtsW
VDLKSVIDTRRRGAPDIILFLTVFMLIGIGIAMSYSASAVCAGKVFNASFYFLKKQLIWFCIGFFVLFIFHEIDYKKYLSLTKILLIVSIILLVAVFIPGIGHSAKGAMRWISLGPIRIQPSEFVKIFIVIYLVKVFSIEKNNKANPVLQLLVPMIILGVMFMLILLQPDFGTAVDLLFVSVAVMFVSGFSIIQLFLLSIISVPAFYLLVYQVNYRRDRIMAFFDPWSYRYGIGYHIIQSFIAFKKGSLVGAGLGYGTQKLSRLPEPHTDFIFSVIAEETGFLGTSVVILLFCLFFWRGLQIALSAPDDFGRLLAIAITLLVSVQAFINIGVVTGALPTTGIPLPFISYGGSSLLSNMICVGILLNISRYRDVVNEDFKIAGLNAGII